MCGVALVVGDVAGLDPGPALAALTGRGPDGWGIQASGDALMLATRLMQWDEGSPVQPLRTAAGDLVAFNGELFNLTELQREVGLPGASEVAVLAQGLRRIGPGFLTRVDGQFAVVARLADGTTYAARDRFGIAPLFWSATERRVVMASNLPAVLELRGLPPQRSVAGLAGLVREWAPVGADSPYRGVHQVEPGCVLVLRPGAAPVAERWAGDARPTVSSALISGPPVAAPWEYADFEEALRESVRRRLRSLSPVTCLLSGGVDSTVLAAIARQEGVGAALGLFVSGDDLTRDRQQQVAGALDMTLEQLELTPAMTLATFEEYVARRAMPLVRMGPVGMTALARHARGLGVRAVLSGEGADELLCGYDAHRLIAGREGLFGPPELLDFSLFGISEIDGVRGARWQSAYWRTLIRLSAPQTGERAAVWRPVADLFGPELRAALAVAGGTPEEGGGVEPGALAVAGPPPVVTTLLAQRRQHDLDTLLASYLLLVQGDQAWAEEGVELRPAYLGASVADWALAREPADFVGVAAGKIPVRALLRRLALGRPGLATLDVAKSAFRVDAGLVLRDPLAADRLIDMVSACPPELVDTAAFMPRLLRARGDGRLGEAEAMLATMAASWGILSARGG